MQITFYPHKSRPKGKVYLHYRYTHSGSSKKGSTGIQIRMQDWDSKRNQPKPRAVNRTMILAAMEGFRRRLEDEITILLKEGREISGKALAEHLEQKRIEEEKERLGFWDYWQMFWEERVKDLNEGTKMIYLNTEQHLRSFEDQYMPLTFEFSEKELESLNNYFQKRAVMDSTLNSYYSKLKAFLRYGYEKDWHDNKFYLRWKLPSLSTTPKPALTPGEVILILGLSLPLKEVIFRDYLVMLCLTGLRHSEAQSVSFSDIDFEGKTLKYVVKKKRTDFVLGEVPLIDLVLSLFQKYKGFPKFNSPQSCNYHLKMICKKAGLTRMVKSRGDTKPLYKCISTHTGRVTCKNLLFANDVTAQNVKDLWGESDIKNSLEHYRNSNKDAAIDKARSVLNGLFK